MLSLYPAQDLSSSKNVSQATDVIVLVSVTDLCACSVQAVCTFDPKLKPRLPEEGRNKRRTEKRNTMVFLSVLLFLVLEMLVCVFLPLVAKSKYR